MFKSSIISINTNLVLEKVKRKVWSKIVSMLIKTSFYPYIYKSYWHYKFSRKSTRKKLYNNYFTAIPNPGAGIGHQIANWIAGYWFAQKFNLKFAHAHFSSSDWNKYLAFGENEIKTEELIKRGYKIIKLPKFDEYNSEEVSLIKNIIDSYNSNNILFIAEQDQYYRDQFGIINQIKNKFYNSPERFNDNIIYNQNNFNIAIHVRRGDILSDLNNPNLSMRYISNEYFENVLDNVLKNIQPNKDIHIYFFSQGKTEDFPNFTKYKNLHWCLEMNPKESFTHMVFADLLITSKSSFSYKPALLNNGIKICPKNFWHAYPIDKKWILCDNDGNICYEQIVKLNGLKQR